jgi:hypothetical protein
MTGLQPNHSSRYLRGFDSDIPAERLALRGCWPMRILLGQVGLMSVGDVGRGGALRELLVDV